MTTIIPVASGKGGVGKSLITANLSLALAELGYRVVAADLDFGGANLHNYLGLKNNNPGLGEYLQGRVENLQDLMVPTEHSRLWFLPGEGTTPFLADLQVVARRQLIQDLRQLPVDLLLLDLSGGSSQLTLDFFGASPYGLLVTRPDAPSAMNLLSFLKQLAFRNLLHLLPEARDLHEAVRQMLFLPINTKPGVTVERIYELVAEHDPVIAESLQQRWSSLQARVLFNLVERHEDLSIWNQVQTLARERLSLELGCWAEFPVDAGVMESLRRQTPLFLTSGGEAFIQHLQHLAVQISENWGDPALLAMAAQEETAEE